MASVDEIYKEFRDAEKILEGAGEISLVVTLESNLRKSLLLSAASYFEYKLTKEVENFSEEAANGNVLLTSLVFRKAISRQYHTWFDWNARNANQFFSLFGPHFKEHMGACLKESDRLASGMAAFMEIGADRNQLVHSDYASFLINKTPDEIYSSYLLASYFVDVVSIQLRECSKKLLGA